MLAQPGIGGQPPASGSRGSVSSPGIIGQIMGSLSLTALVVLVEAESWS